MDDKRSLHLNAGRKRRYRPDSSDDIRSNQRRRYEQTPTEALCQALKQFADSGNTRIDEEIAYIEATTRKAWDDSEVHEVFANTILDVVGEQPFKIPFIAAGLIALNVSLPDAIIVLLQRCGERVETSLRSGTWRELKLQLRLLACLQPILQGDGILKVLEDLFEKAVELQTGQSEDAHGMDLVKTILLTLAYLLATRAFPSQDRAIALLEKTDVIASIPHPFEELSHPFKEPYSGQPQFETPTVLGLLQRQLHREAQSDWPLRCLPMSSLLLKLQDSGSETQRHKIPEISIPLKIPAGDHPRTPEVYLSVFDGNQSRTVPAKEDVSSILIRDLLTDTINLLDCNRNAVAKFLVNMDLFLADEIFSARGTSYDRMHTLGDEAVRYKPEDVAVDAVFASLFELPAPARPNVYYHSVLTEACKLAPSAMAPSLGRAIRNIYQNVQQYDLEILHRFISWFSHHLSNFNFTWKWNEWADDMKLADTNWKKIVLSAMVEKEIRLSFSKRIAGTLPELYHSLSSLRTSDQLPKPDILNDGHIWQSQAEAIIECLKTRPEPQILDEKLKDIQKTLTGSDSSDADLADIFVTSICFLGAKSLSHTISWIDRFASELVHYSQQNDEVQQRMVGAVMEFWREHPGTGMSVVEKLLNYGIVKPIPTLHWVKHIKPRLRRLSYLQQFEMALGIAEKVRWRLRQQADLRQSTVTGPEESGKISTDASLMAIQRKSLSEGMSILISGASKEQPQDGENNLTQEVVPEGWDSAWVRVFSRKHKIDSIWLQECDRPA